MLSKDLLSEVPIMLSEGPTMHALSPKRTLPCSNHALTMLYHALTKEVSIIIACSQRALRFCFIYMLACWAYNGLVVLDKKYIK